MDFVDPSDAPGVGTPVARRAWTYREAHLAMEMIADTESHGFIGDRRDQSSH